MKFGEELIEPKGVIFDVDGTATNTEPLMINYNLQLLQESVFYLHFIQAIAPFQFSDLPRYPGKDMKGHIMLWIQNYADGCEDLTAMFRQFYLGWLSSLEALWHEHQERIEVFPDFAVFLSHLEEANTPYTYATNNQKAVSKVILTKANLGSGNRGLTTATESRKPKPHPEIHMRALMKLGIPKEDVISVGDSEGDMESAMTAGVGRGVLIDRKQKSPPELVGDFQNKVLRVSQLTDLVISSQ